MYALKDQRELEPRLTQTLRTKSLSSAFQPFAVHKCDKVIFFVRVCP